MEHTPPWYVAAFQDDYLSRYRHRNKAQANTELPLLLHALDLRRGSCVLDLCCGAGRHSGGLARADLCVVGVDLSFPLLQRARAEHPEPTFARSDMRQLPFRDEAFGGVVNLFTSFGYFEHDHENLTVAREVVRVLKPGGRFVLDFFNLDATLPALVTESTRRVDGEWIVECRRYDSARKRLEKETLIERAGAAPLRFLESVRAYDATELAALLESVGLTVLARYGDLSGADFDRLSSLRCVTLGAKQ